MTDGGVNIKEVVGLSKEYAISLFSMNLDVVGEFICNVKVMQLNIDNALSVDIDAWMVCSTSDLYAYSLSQFLYDHDLSEQIVFN